eukprot:2305420-Pyramimonas_sp.AAC.1
MRFDTLCELIIHQVHSRAPGHGWPPTLIVTLDNQRLTCRTVFPNVERTSGHRRRSWPQARCISELTRHQHEWKPTQ